MKTSTPSSNNSPGIPLDPATLQIERLLPGPIERVWAYLTESDKRAQWLASGPMELRKDGALCLGFDNSNLTPRQEIIPEKYREASCGKVEGKIIACKAPRLLSYTWGNESDASEVTFELSTRGENVFLVLTHRKLPNRDQMLGVAPGWHTHLGILIEKLNGRIPSPFWSTYTALQKEYEKMIET